MTTNPAENELAHRVSVLEEKSKLTTKSLEVSADTHKVACERINELEKEVADLAKATKISLDELNTRLERIEQQIGSLQRQIATLSRGGELLQ